MDMIKYTLEQIETQICLKNLNKGLITLGIKDALTGDVSFHGDIVDKGALVCEEGYLKLFDIKNERMPLKVAVDNIGYLRFYHRREHEYTIILHENGGIYYCVLDIMM